MMANGFIVPINQSINPHYQLACFNNFLSRGSAPLQTYRSSIVGTFFATLDASTALSRFFHPHPSNKDVGAGLSLRSDAIHPLTSLLWTLFVNGETRGYLENSEKKGGEMR